MSYTLRCSICHELTDVDAYPELNVSAKEPRRYKWICCSDCWHRIQEYLTDRGFSIIQPAQ